jgi:hypothetical protein
MPNIEPEQPLTLEQEAVCENTSADRLRELVQMGLDLAKRVARSASADSELLQELSFHEDAIVRQGVASNPNTPTEVLLRLGAEFPSELLDNPVFSLLILENPNLVNEMSIATLRSVLRLPQVPFFLIEQAADKTDHEVQLALAMNLQTPQKVLERLTHSNFPEVSQAACLHINLVGEFVGDELTEAIDLLRHALDRVSPLDNTYKNEYLVLAQLCAIPQPLFEHWLTSPNYFNFRENLAAASATAPELVEKLAGHSAVQMRQAVLRNPSVSIDILEALAHDSETLIRLDVIQNPKTPLHVLKQLAKDSERGLAERANLIVKRHQQISDVIAALEEPSLTLETKRAVAALPYNAPVSSEVLIKLAKHPYKRVREWVAQHPQTSSALLDELALDKEVGVRDTVAKNPNTSLQTLLKELARSITTCHTVAYCICDTREHTPEADDILDLLATMSTWSVEAIVQRLIQMGNLKTKQFLARRRDLPVEAIAQLAQIEDSEVQQAIAQNPNAPVQVLEHLAKSENLAVKGQVATNINAPSSVLEELAEHSFKQVRCGAMTNPNLSPESAVKILCGKYASEFVSVSSYCRSLSSEHLSQIFNHYAQSESRFARWIALSQPQVSPEILEKQSRSIDWLDRFAVAQNLATPLDVRQLLAQDSNHLVRAAARRL